MTFALACAVVILTVAFEIAVPGASVYHAGWFNVALIAVGAFAIASARGAYARSQTATRRAGIAAAILGVALATLAGAASGLLAPDNRTLVGAPGQSVRVDDLGGTLEFPAADVSSGAAASVFLQRRGSPLAIGPRGRNVGTFVLHPQARTVVLVEARDARGGRLTVTQPSGSAFLSPVLLMQQRQTIAGFDVPVDSFAVPAAHRLVRVVLFDAEEAAMMRGLQGGTGPALLFAVDDESDRPLPHGVDAARSGASIAIGGLLLRATVFSYPAIEIVATPSLAVTILAAALVLVGLLARLEVASGSEQSELPKEALK